MQWSLSACRTAPAMPQRSRSVEGLPDKGLPRILGFVPDPGSGISGR
jgi:hypothetical protein